MTRIAMYLCGGTGVNIGSHFAHLHGKVDKDFASIDTYVVDTSDSNLPKDGTFPDDRVFLFKDPNGVLLNGNGKVRSANYEIISEPSTIQSILHKFKPGDLNVIISSGGGGTGSVAGPLLVKALIEKKLPVMVLLVGSVISRMDIQNTIKTIKTYESLATKLNTPINVLYRENGPQSPRKKVDEEMRRYIYLLSAFFSGNNHGLDGADLKNFLDYTKVTSYQPKMTAVDLFTHKAILPEDSLAITAVTLNDEADEVSHDFLVDYQVTGVPSAGMMQNLKTMIPLHMVLFSGFFPNVLSKLSQLVGEHEDKATRMVGRPATSTPGSNDDGMVL